ncbi:MAG: hypothetical protein EOO43_10080, partial [Flavobacterium sp.]
MTVSFRKSSLKNIPEKFTPTVSDQRGSPKLIEEIREQSEIDYSDIYVLGAKHFDIAQAAHSKLLLLSALYAKENNPSDRLYKNGYGIPISSAESLRLFFERFSTVNNPWFFKLDVSKTTTLYALTNAEEYTQEKAIREIVTKFQLCLKRGKSEYSEPFINFFLVSVYKLYQEAYMPWERTSKILEVANECGLVCFSSPFDFSAVDFLERLNMPAYKIASF